MKYLLRIENTILLEKTSISQEVEILTYYQSLNSQFFVFEIVPTIKLKLALRHARIENTIAGQLCLVLRQN